MGGPGAPVRKSSNGGKSVHSSEPQAAVKNALVQMAQPAEDGVAPPRQAMKNNIVPVPQLADYGAAPLLQAAAGEHKMTKGVERQDSQGKNPAFDRSRNADGRMLRNLDPNASSSYRRVAKKQRALTCEARDHEEHGHGSDHHGSGHHGHGGSPSWPNAIASGIINYLLMFGLCCAYGMIMFDKYNARHRAIGVKLNLCTAMLFGFLLAGCSQVKVAVGGPDLNPVVFLGGFVTTISLSIAEQVGLEHPLAADDGRRLLYQPTPPPQAAFCAGPHDREACDAYDSQVVATSIFAVAVSSAVLSTVFFFMGQFRLLQYVSYVPTCVMEAFMACVGYKVFKYAIGFCNYEPRQFIPAACVGVPLYFLKAYHIGNPVVVIPSFLLLPLALFYASTYLSGSSLSEEGEWMFPKIENVGFWQIWTDTIKDGGSNINFKAWTKTGTDLVVMVIVCFLDCLLKMMGTEGKLPVKIDKNREMRLYGLGNVVTTLCGSSVGYAQLKFNVINYGILGGLDRRGGLVYAILCGATFFWTIEHFNYLPRFFLGIMLFFAGSGFIVENLWGSRAFLSLFEWGQVLVILAVFIAFQDLLYAVVTGGVLTCLEYIITCARVPCTAGKPGTYHEFSAVRRTPLSKVALGHILSSELLVVRLKGEIFFASAQELVNSLLDRIQEGASLPKYKRLRYLIFDCTLVEGIDASTGKLLRKLTEEAHRCNVSLMYVGPKYTLRERLKQQMLLEHQKHLYASVEQAVESIEDRGLDRMEQFKGRWTSLHKSLELYNTMMIQKHCLDPFREVFKVESVRRGCPHRFCVGFRLKQHRTILWEPGETNVGLFLVTSGSVALFRSLPESGETEPDGITMSAWVDPVAIYRGGWFLNRKALLDLPTEYYAVAYEDGDVLYWSQNAWAKMARDLPRMTESISKEAMKQMGLDMADPQKISAVYLCPKEVDKHIANMRVAQTLASLGFYNSCPGHKPEATLLPKLPASLRKDLRTSFNIFTESEFDGLLHPHKISAALMLAGILRMGNTNPQLSDNERLSFTEFELLAHEAAQMKITEELVTMLTKIFDENDSDKSGSINHEELAEILSQVFVREHLSVEEIESFFDEWLDVGMQEFDRDTFVAFIARFAKLHEQDWHLYIAFKELFGEQALNNERDPIDRSTLETVCAPLLDEECPLEYLEFMTRWQDGTAERQISLQDILGLILLPPWKRKPPMPCDLIVQDDLGEHAEGDAGVEEYEAEAEAKDHTLTTSAANVALTRNYTVRQKLHLLFEDPISSSGAAVLWFVMTLLIILSVLTLIAEPLLPKHRAIIYVEGVFTIIFTIEYLCRLLVANAFGTSILSWALQPAQICDLIAVVPFYVLFAIGSEEAAADSIIFRVIRLVRLSRIGRMGRLHNKCPIVGPIAIVLLLIWFIYLKSSGKK